MLDTPACCSIDSVEPRRPRLTRRSPSPCRCSEVCEPATCLRLGRTCARTLLTASQCCVLRPSTDMTPSIIASVVILLKSALNSTSNSAARVVPQAELEGRLVVGALARRLAVGAEEPVAV